MKSTKNDKDYDKLLAALDIIDELLGSTVGNMLLDGHADYGTNWEYKYDSKLIIDLAKSIKDWKERNNV